MTKDGERHWSQLRSAEAEIRARINAFTLKTFRCRGGRLGSGMGNLLEALWGFYSREVLSETTPGEYEVAWIVDHAYNDFALLDATKSWDPATHAGECLRIEAKSMNLGADEAKGHFDALAAEIAEDDLLLILVWRWSDIGGGLVFPEVVGEFVGPAREVAELRDALHIARGGFFVTAGACPDCRSSSCPHVGEPLNSNGNRERLSGPPSARSKTVGSAANFGGLVRMTKARGAAANAVLAEQLKFPVRREYIEFVRTFEDLLGS